MAITAGFICINIGSFVSPLYFNYFNNNLDNASLYISILILIFFLLALIFLPEIKNKEPIEHMKYKVIFEKKYRYFLVFFSSVVLYSICEYVYSNWGVVLLKSEKGFNLEVSRFGLSTFWASVGITQILIFFLLKYLNIKKIYRVLPFFISIGFFVMIFSKKFSLIGLALGGIGGSAFVALSLSYVEYLFNKIAQIASSTIFLGFFSGYIIGSLLISTLLDFTSLTNSFFVIGILSVIIILNTLYLTKKFKIEKESH